MTKEQIVLMASLIIASLFLFVTSVVIFGVGKIRSKRAPERYNRVGVGSAFVFSIFLLLSIWLLRFAVGYFDILVYAGEALQLTPQEEIANSLFGALRTFSMEEEYAEYILDIKALITAIIPNEHPSFSAIKIATVVYASLLNLIAPILGGAIVLEIVASVFPKFKLIGSYFKINRPKYFFSELNSASLSLAKSIYNKEKSKKPILIFTDTYVDDKEEKEYELLLEAKKYGAICIRDDLAHVIKTKCGERTYFLIDENEFGNFQTLIGLTEDHNVKFVKDSRIYLFVQSDAYVQIEKQINREFGEERKKKLLKGGKKPTIIPLNGYRNLVQNLFVDVPLYEPLINKKNNTQLSVTILGNGTIGTEAFLNAYWFGQMMVSRDDSGQKSMSECEMTINVVSKEREEAFWSKIDCINPEIKGTVEVSGNPAVGNKNNPYCRVNYIEADVKLDGLWDSDSEKTRGLLDSDYFIVALGSDADNISVGDKLRRLVGKRHLEESDETSGQVIIAYAVFNSELVNTLNKQKNHQCRTKDRTDVYTYAFGSLEDVYSYENVYMSKNRLLAEGTGAAYDRAQMMQKHVEEHKTRSNDDNKNYSYWADLARAMHIKYKAFSLGLIRKSIFDCTPQDHENYVKEQCNLYKKLTSYNAGGRFKEIDENELRSFEAKKHTLAWLEHRRWVAFTRSLGYQYTGELGKNLRLSGKNHKNMELKLHPCLVEAEKPSEENPSYLNDKWQDLFTNLPDKFDSDKLDKATMLALLGKKKQYLIEKCNKLEKYDSNTYDALDQITLDWCKEATLFGIEMLSEAIESLESSESVTEYLRGKSKAAWDGIGCYDFKMYDYCRYDYDDYLTDKELAKILGVESDYIAKLCKSKKFKSAEYLKESSEWHIPFSSVKGDIYKCCRELDINNADDQRLIGDRAHSENSTAFELFGKWYKKI